MDGHGSRNGRQHHPKQQGKKRPRSGGGPTAAAAAASSTAAPAHNKHGDGTAAAAAAAAGQQKRGEGQRSVFKQHVEARKALPIYKHRERIVEAIRSHPSTVLVAETGSGKSTQVPQFLLEAGFCKPQGQGQQGQQQRRGMIACTQPRRVAAMTVAGRVAEEMGTRLGQAVGYAVRFDDRTSERTVLKYVTDGLLLREAMADPLLRNYAVIVLDEAHERSLQTDILFGLIRRAQRQRPELRVVVMSATLDVELFRNFFDTGGDRGGKGTVGSKAQGGGGEGEKGTESPVAVVRVEGRQFPVEVFFCGEPQEDVIDAAFLAVLQIHEAEPLPGDILVFLAGQEDIEALTQLLEEEQQAIVARAAAAAAKRRKGVEDGDGGEAEDDGGAGPPKKMEVCPLFAALPQEQQLRAFRPVTEPDTTRKVILATNIAETSVTINGVKHVVDAGWVKVRRYVSSTGLDSLRSTQVAKAQAQQRAGRAGREAPGSCYRLYTEAAYEAMAAAPEPEIQRANLDQVVLQLMAMGIHEPQRFDYLSPPSPQALTRALSTLYALGCIEVPSSAHTHDQANGSKGSSGSSKGGTGTAPFVTEHGRKVAALPLDPMYAHFVLKAGEMGCVAEALTAVAMLSAENVLYMPSQHGGAEAAARRAKAIAAHKALSDYEGDVPTLIHVYERWRRAPGKDARAKRGWCWDKFVNARSVERAHDVRVQLAGLVQRLGVDPLVSCGAERQLLSRCLAAGLFLNIAQRIPSSQSTSGRGCYKSVHTGKEVAIHPSSVLHGRNPPPACVVYTEVLTTSRTYIRGVTIADAAAVQALVPRFMQMEGGGGGGGGGSKG